MSNVLQFIFAPGMFTQSYMINAWLGATIVAIIAGFVGFFVVLRGTAFVAHALPKGGFAGAAGAALLNQNTELGLILFTVGGAMSIGWLGRKGSHGVVTALILVFLLGLGSLFLDLNNVYAPEIFSLLFGEILGVNNAEVAFTGWIGFLVVISLLFMFRPLLFSSISGNVARARGIHVNQLDMLFLIIVGLATAITVPIVGALLTFSLMIAPAAAAGYITHHPIRNIAVSIAFALLTVWLALLIAYDTGWPVGFFVASFSTICYGMARFSYSLRKHKDAHLYASKSGTSYMDELQQL
ncbi:MAG: metal ABC transporter permease [Acidibacillus sp.]|nr:metal ABC transporter permease [Acidibacillus sp.]